MKRVNRILKHPLWQGAMAQIESMEETRIYCKHDLSHLLDTARLAYIENLEADLGLSKELIYAAALLHDIGRGMEYEQGVPHHTASCVLAGTVLRETGFCEEECRAIIEAIGTHREPDARLKPDFPGLLYRADKGSRNCFYCKQQSACYWSEEKKNMELEG